MRLYKFPPMLGPAEEWPEGTPDWAMRMGNRLKYQIQAAGKDGVGDLVPTVRKVMSVIPHPWEVWPEPPAGTPDAYFQLCAGKTYRQIWGLIDTYEQDHGLALEFETQQARAEAATVPATGGRPSESPYAIRRLSDGGGDGGTSSRYLLRRLARAADGPAKDALEAYERGEFRSVREAATAAGIAPAAPRIPLTDPSAVTRKLIAQGDDFASEVMEGLRAYFSAKERV